MTSPHPLGPYFAVERLSEVPDRSSAWRALGPDLTDAELVDAWVRRAWERTAGGLPASPSDRRTLGAVLHLGVLARLTSPWIARFLLGCDGEVPTLDDLWWRDDGTTMFPLAVIGAPACDEPVNHTSLGDINDFARRLVRRIVLPLDVSTFTPSAAIRRGNAASAINTAAGLVVRQPMHDERHCAAAHDLVVACLRILDAGTPAGRGEPMTATFRRTSCCLAYALPGGTRAAVCGDCVLRE